MGMNSRRVLVVEDERDIARLLALHLEDLGCEVDTSYDGRTGLARSPGRNRVESPCPGSSSSGARWA